MVGGHSRRILSVPHCETGSAWIRATVDPSVRTNHDGLYRAEHVPIFHVEAAILHCTAQILIAIERCFELDGAAVTCDQPRGIDRLLQIQVVIDHVGECIQHNADDAAATRGTKSHERLAVLEYQG